MFRRKDLKFDAADNIDEDYIKNSHIFPHDFITKCKQFPNEPQNISSDVKK